MGTNLITQQGNLSEALDSLTLDQAYQLIGGDHQSHIPFLVWLLENPDSVLALPGKIYLKEHDLIHIILNRGFSLDDEAYVVGFTMGNDSKTTRWHLLIFKLCSSLFYPKKFKFDRENLKNFDLGFLLGKNLPTKNINQMDFAPHLQTRISQLRAELGIDTATIFQSKKNDRDD
jgi:hypothetical protein